MPEHIRVALKRAAEHTVLALHEAPGAIALVSRSDVTPQ
jgi:hypothetical protein